MQIQQTFAEWGEFYEVAGEGNLLNAPVDWKEVYPDQQPAKHYLFYLRDETFECSGWVGIQKMPENALIKLRSSAVCH